MLIDPRGMTGESAYDVAVLAIRAVRFHSSVNLVPHIAGIADIAVERVRIWMTVANATRV
jgi:hypothetical protein